MFFFHLLGWTSGSEIYLPEVNIYLPLYISVCQITPKTKVKFNLFCLALKVAANCIIHTVVTVLPTSFEATRLNSSFQDH